MSTGYYRKTQGVSRYEYFHGKRTASKLIATDGELIFTTGQKIDEPLSWEAGVGNLTDVVNEMHRTLNTQGVTWDKAAVKLRELSTAFNAGDDGSEWRNQNQILARREGFDYLEQTQKVLNSQPTTDEEKKQALRQIIRATAIQKALYGDGQNSNLLRPSDSEQAILGAKGFEVTSAAGRLQCAWSRPLMKSDEGQQLFRDNKSTLDMKNLGDVSFSGSKGNFSAILTQKLGTTFVQVNLQMVDKSIRDYVLLPLDGNVGDAKSAMLRLAKRAVRRSAGKLS